MPRPGLRDAATVGGGPARASGPGAAASGLKRGREAGSGAHLKRACGTLRCCQVTLPKAQADIKASPAELAKIARFLHHYSNGSVRRIAGDLAPGVLMLDPLYAAAHSQVRRRGPARPQLPLCQTARWPPSSVAPASAIAGSCEQRAPKRRRRRGIGQLHHLQR
jgi:hypothetical protein